MRKFKGHDSDLLENLRGAILNIKQRGMMSCNEGTTNYSHREHRRILVSYTSTQPLASLEKYFLRILLINLWR